MVPKNEEAKDCQDRMSVHAVIGETRHLKPETPELVAPEQNKIFICSVDAILITAKLQVSSQRAQNN